MTEISLIVTLNKQFNSTLVNSKLHSGNFRVLEGYPVARCEESERNGRCQRKPEVNQRNIFDSARLNTES